MAPVADPKCPRCAGYRGELQRLRGELGRQRRTINPPLDQSAASEEASGKALHVEVVFFTHGAIARCQCALCNAVKSALIDARKVGSQTKLVLTFVPGETGWPYE